MKNIYNFKSFMFAIAVLLLLLVSVQTTAFGQCFGTAVLPTTMPPGDNNDSRAGSHAVVSATGAIGSLWINGVAVPPGYTFSCDGTPDVSILVNGVNTYALVVYYSTSFLGGSYLYDLYQVGTGWTAFGILEAPALGATGVVHIDADWGGVYDIVWDDMLGIQHCLNAFPFLPTVFTNIGLGTSPDVAIGGFTSFYVSSLAGGINGWSSTGAPVYSGLGNKPHIACNAFGTSNFVVFEGVNPPPPAPPVVPVQNHIYGSLNAGLPFDYTNPPALFNCTDLTICPQGNSDPATTFDNAGNIIISWFYSTAGYIAACPPSPPGAMLPIAVRLNAAGNPVTIVGQYMAVDPASGPWPFIGTISPKIALSGKSQPNIMYTWSAGSKDVPWGSATLRLEEEQATELVGDVYPNPTNGSFFVKVATEKDEALTIEIYNSLGQQVYSSIDVSSSTNFNKEIALANNKAGIYFVRVVGKSTTINWKILLTN